MIRVDVSSAGTSQGETFEEHLVDGLLFISQIAVTLGVDPVAPCVQFVVDVFEKFGVVVPQKGPIDELN